MNIHAKKRASWIYLICGTWTKVTTLTHAVWAHYECRVCIKLRLNMPLLIFIGGKRGLTMWLQSGSDFLYLALAMTSCQCSRLSWVEISAVAAGYGWYFLWGIHVKDEVGQQRIDLTIAPVFISATIYLCLSRIIVIYGVDNSRFRPRTYTAVFLSCDFISLLLQTAGGAFADTHLTNLPLQNTGVHIMVTGLAFQVASLFLFAALCVEYALRVMKKKGH